MKKLCFFITLVCVTGFCYGQNSSTDYPEVVPPPPSVASLMRFEEVPVDYYSGQPNIAIPLASMSINKDLSYPLALRYNTQALRVDERSGWTSTGFSLTSPGTISRTIKGLPDELNNSFKGKGIYHNTYYDHDILLLEEKQRLYWNSAYGSLGDRWDTEQDLYQYSYLGGSGRFIIVKESAGGGNFNLRAVITESDTNDKIDLEWNSTTFEITKFTITDTKGYRYIFTFHNENHITSWTSSTPQKGSGSNTSADYMGANNVPNAWYVEKILQPNDEEICTFVYQDVTENYHTPYTITKNELKDRNFIDAGPQAAHGYNNSLLLPKLILASQSISSDQKYLREVIFRDNSKVVFNLTKDHPEYGDGSSDNGAKLNSIEIRDSNAALNKRIELTYETTPNTRLFLTEVKEIFSGTGNELTYTIDYNNKEELPGFDDPHQDVFGYYNGPDSDNPLQIISLADPEKATIGAISSITYPTGGKKEFVFESNSYGYEGSSQVDVATIPENRMGTSVAGSLSIDLMTQVSSGAYLLYLDEDQKMMINTSITSSGSHADHTKHRIRFHAAEPKPGVTITNPTGEPNYSNYNISDFQYDTNGNVREFDLLNTNTVTNISGGWYFVELTTPAVEVAQGPSFINLDFTLNYSFFQLNTVSKKGGGIRIKEVLFTDEGVEKRKVEYVYMDNPHLNTGGIGGGVPQDFISSGSFEVNPNTRSYLKWKKHPFVTGVNCVGFGMIQRTPNLVEYTVTRDISAIYTSNTKGNYVGYRYVMRKETGKGSELFTYTSPREVQVQVGVQVATYPFKPHENLDYKRGVLEKREVFLEKAIGETIPKILSEEIYDYYDFSSIEGSSLMTFEVQNLSCPWTQFYDTFDNYKNFIPVNRPYNPCGGTAVEQSVATCYGESDVDIISTTYNYRKGVKLPKEIIKKQFFYDNSTLSHTVTSTDKMLYNTKNRLREQQTEINEGGNLITLQKKIYYPYTQIASQFTSAERTIFDLMETKNIIEVPVYTETLRNSELLSKTKTIFDQVSTNNFQPINVEVYKAAETEANEIVFTSYDEFGNLQEVSKEDGTQIVYIWGYDKTVPVAKIENATYSQVASYVGNIQTKSNEDNDRTKDTVSTSDIITYVGEEGELRQALQNLRNALSSAMVTSFTYDPLIGVTSITDPRGQTMYYEYDEFNRLKSVKDAYGKIVSENKYNYKN
jgi:YD repeat-containing protein